MTLYVASVTPRGSRSKSSAAGKLVAEYLERAGRYASVEPLNFSDEEALFTWTGKEKGRTGCFVILLDSAGRQLSSEEFAAFLTKLRDEGQQRILLAVGPANGWSDASRSHANLLFSLGRITLPHELAAAVLAEQIYRALTIAAGHPYHCGH
jgi:23S rRNA (pseudouridine1915-N3)-methyltransferase